MNNEVYEHQAFALARLRGKNVSGAIAYIERHAPMTYGFNTFHTLWNEGFLMLRDDMGQVVDEFDRQVEI